eukprot:3511397-Karenia_brevis.AAC.1
MVDKDGVRKDSKQDVVDVFADFYEQLYMSKHRLDCIIDESDLGPELPEVSVTEVQTELKKMAKKKGADTSGIVCEMLQSGSLSLHVCIATMFTKILQGSWEPPISWKKSFITVLYKKGDPKL